MNITIAGKALITKMTEDLVQLLEFHTKVLETFLTFYVSTESVETLFQDRSFIDYFNALLIEWHTLKLNSRNEGILLVGE